MRISIKIDTRIKGVTPIITSVSVPFSLNPWIIKRLTPTGGVIKAICVNSVTTTPNQIGSNPRFEMTGNTTGKVIMRTGRLSITQPSTKYIRQKARSTAVGEISVLTIHLAML